MHIKHLISAAAIALIAGFGSAQADEDFTYLEGVDAVPVLPEEAGVIRGTGVYLFVIFAGPGFTEHDVVAEAQGDGRNIGDTRSGNFVGLDLAEGHSPVLVCVTC